MEEVRKELQARRREVHQVLANHQVLGIGQYACNKQGDGVKPRFGRGVVEKEKADPRLPKGLTGGKNAQTTKDSGLQVLAFELKKPF